MAAQPEQAAGLVAADRRQNPRLRDKYEDASRLLASLLETSSDTSSGTMLYRAMHRLQKAFPELSVTEVESLTMAVIRASRHP